MGRNSFLAAKPQGATTCNGSAWDIHDGRNPMTPTAKIPYETLRAIANRTHRIYGKQTSLCGCDREKEPMDLVCRGCATDELWRRENPKPETPNPTQLEDARKLLNKNLRKLGLKAND